MSVCDGGDCDNSDIKEEPADSEEVKSETFPDMLHSEDPKDDSKMGVEECQFRKDTMTSVPGNLKKKKHNKAILTRLCLGSICAEAYIENFLHLEQA